MLNKIRNIPPSIVCRLLNLQLSCAPYALLHQQLQMWFVLTTVHFTCLIAANEL